MSKLAIQPRIIRAKDAPSYLGMCRTEFEKTVRPHVREFPIGKQGVGFDRLDLDAWADAYIAAHSIDKRASSENAKLFGPRAAMGKSQATPRKLPSEKVGDPHEKSKENFQKALQSVREKKRPKIK